MRNDTERPALAMLLILILGCESGRSGVRTPAAIPDGGPTEGSDGGAAEDTSVDEESGVPVKGTAVAIGWGRGVAGRRVEIGGQSVITDRDGAFEFDSVPAAYDVVVSEPDGLGLSVYYGLSRRDPVLSHDATYDPTLDAPTRSASISGSLSGAISFPLDADHVVGIYYLSAVARANVQLSVLPSMSGGPQFGPFQIAWNDASTVEGDLVALGQYGTASAPWLGAYLGRVGSVVLTQGVPLVEDLTLDPVPTGHIGGTVAMYPGNVVEAINLSYQPVRSKGQIGLGRFVTAGKFDCIVPDLSSIDGSYCMSIADEWGEATVVKCGGRIGMTDLSVQVPAPPQFSKPQDGAPITKDTSIAWSAVPGAAYLLDLSPDAVAAETPHIQVYTAKTAFRWGDLVALGISFPPGATYTHRVSALVPYASADELASSSGLFQSGLDRQQLDSNPVDLVLVQ